MRGSAIVLGVTAAWCVACSGVLDKASEVAVEQALEAGADGTVDVDLNGPNGEIKVQTENGSAVIGAGAKLPEDLPIALPAGAWETQMVISTPEGTMITVKPPAGATGLDTYFKGELVRLGCATPNFAQMPGMTTFQCADLPNFETLAVNFMGEGAEQVVQLVYKKAAPADGAAAPTPAP
jgi:hypothetical protein